MNVLPNFISRISFPPLTSYFHQNFNLEIRIVLTIFFRKKYPPFNFSLVLKKLACFQARKMSQVSVEESLKKHKISLQRSHSKLVNFLFGDRFNFILNSTIHVQS